jgi:hypothetical protein
VPFIATPSLGAFGIMTIGSRLASALVLLVLATVAAVGLLANYFGATGPNGLQKALLAGGAVAVLLALLAAHLIARSISEILAAEAARREAIFQQSVDSEKNRGDALSKRFDEALKQAKQEPVTKPMRDFDLD